MNQYKLSLVMGGAFLQNMNWSLLKTPKKKKERKKDHNSRIKEVEFINASNTKPIPKQNLRGKFIVAKLMLVYPCTIFIGYSAPSPFFFSHDRRMPGLRNGEGAPQSGLTV